MEVFENFNIKSLTRIPVKKPEYFYDAPYFYSPRNWQKDCFTVMENENYRAIISPTGSGKSSIILSLAHSDLIKNKCNKVIILVPQLSIASGYREEINIIHNNRKYTLSVGVVLDCKEKQTRTTELENFFRKGNTSHIQIKDKILVCSYASFIPFYKENKKKKWFDNTALWIDESHHLCTYMTKEDDEDVIAFNGLSTVTSDFIKKNNMVGLTTATYFRGDNNAFFTPDEFDKFKIFKHSYDQYLIEDCEHIKGIKSSTIFYNDEDNYYNVIDKIIRMNKSKERFKPTIIYLPYVNSVYHIDKKEAVKEITALLLKYNKNLNIIDLVSSNKKQKEGIDIISKNNELAKAYHTGQSTTKPDIDVIIALGMFKEGSDYRPIERVVIVGNRSSANEVIQMMGRSLRDYPDKDSEIEVNFVMHGVNQTFERDKIRNNINDNLNIFWTSMLMLELLNPSLKFIESKLKNTNEKEMRDTYDLWIDLFGEKHIEVKNEIYKSILDRIDTDVSKKEQWKQYEQYAKESIKDYNQNISEEDCKKLIKYLKIRIAMRSPKSIVKDNIFDYDLIDEEISPLEFVEEYLHKSFNGINIREYRYKFISTNKTIMQWCQEIKVWKDNHPIFYDLPNSHSIIEKERKLGIWRFTVLRNLPFDEVVKKFIKANNLEHFFWNYNEWGIYWVDKLFDFIYVNKKYPVSEKNKYESLLKNKLLAYKVIKTNNIRKEIISYIEKKIIEYTEKDRTFLEENKELLLWEGYAFLQLYNIFIDQDTLVWGERVDRVIFSLKKGEELKTYYNKEYNKLPIGEKLDANTYRILKAEYNKTGEINHRILKSFDDKNLYKVYKLYSPLLYKYIKDVEILESIYISRMKKIYEERELHCKLTKLREIYSKKTYKELNSLIDKKKLKYLFKSKKYRNINESLAQCLNCFNYIYTHNKLPNREVRNTEEATIYNIIRTKQKSKSSTDQSSNVRIFVKEYDDLADIYGLTGIFDSGFKLDVNKLRKPSQEEIDAILNKCMEEEG